MTERWKKLEGYSPGGYEVSDHGRVRRNGRFLKFHHDRYGYCRIFLRRGGKRKNKTVHSLVANAFLGPRPDGLHVAHLDEDKENNHYSNLKYVTPAENARHSIENGTIAHGERHGRAKLTLGQVLFIRDRLKRGCRTFGVRPLAARFGVDPATIRRAVNGKSWTDLRNALKATQGDTE